MPVDTTATFIDIKSLIEQKAGIRLTFHSHSKDGPEYHGPSPWNGGKDRFACWPSIGRFSDAIRSSGSQNCGDAIDFLRNYPYEGAMTYREACRELGLDVDPAYRSFKFPAVQEDDTLAPPAKWMETGMIILEQAERRLWNNPDGQQMLDYLHNRGLKDEIIKKKRLGYIPFNEKTGRMYEMSFTAWGLTPDMLNEDDRARGCVRVPEGLLIPWFVDRDLWKLTVKRPSMPKGKDYVQILGGQECLYNADLVAFKLPVVMTEAVIDCLSVEQEAGDLVVVVATDGAPRTRQSRWVATLCKAPYILQSFDTDEAGEKGATEWLELLPENHAVRHDPWAHDPNDMLKQGQDIRKWVQVGISMYSDPTLPLVGPVVNEKADESENTHNDILPQKCAICGLDALQHPDTDFIYGEEGTLYCMEHCGVATIDDTAGTFGMEQEALEEPVSPPLTLEEYCRQKYPGKKIRDYIPPFEYPTEEEYLKNRTSKLGKQGYYGQVARENELLVARITAYKEQWGLSA